MNVTENNFTAQNTSNSKQLATAVAAVDKNN